MDKPPQCPDCRQEMEKGFIPDFSHGPSVHAVVQAVWHPGDVQTRTFLGFKTGHIKFEQSEARRIVTYRCPDCGLLRSYAE